MISIVYCFYIKLSDSVARLNAVHEKYISKSTVRIPPCAYLLCNF